MNNTQRSMTIALAGMSFITTIALGFTMTTQAFAQNLFAPLVTREEVKQNFTTGFYHENRGENELAKKYYQKTIDLDTNFALGYMAYGMMEGVVSQRRQWIQKAMSKIEYAKTDYERFWIKGRNAVYGNGNADDEFTSFDEMVKLYPNDAIALYLLGFVYQHHGRSQYQYAIEHLQKAIALYPQFSMALNELAYSFMETQQFKKAEKILLKNIAAVPDKPHSYNSFADYLLRMGKYNQSIAYYQKVIKMDTTFPWAYIGQAANLNFLAKYFAARSTLGHLEHLELTEREAWHQMQAYECSYIAEGKIDSAIIVLDKYAEAARQKGRFTQQYIAHRNKTRIYFEIGDYVNGMKAYQIFNQMVTTNSQNESTKKQVADWGFYYRAYQAYLENKFSEADTLLAQYGAQRFQHDDASRNLRTKILAKQENYTKALETLQQADTTNPYIQYLYGEVYMQMGKKSVARKYAQSVINKNVMQDLEYHIARAKSMKLLQGKAK